MSENIIDLIEKLNSKVNKLLEDSYALDELIRIITNKILLGEETIHLEGLISIIRKLTGQSRISVQSNNTNLKMKERKVILDTLYETRGNQKEAAKILGITPRKLNYKIHYIHKITEFTWRKKLNF